MTSENFQRGQKGTRLRKSYKVKSTIEPLYTGGRVQIYHDDALSASFLLLSAGSQLHFRNSVNGKSVLSLDSMEEETGWQSFLAHQGTLFTVNKDSLVESWAFSLGTSDETEPPAKTLKRSWKTLNPRNSPVVLMAHHPVSPLLVLAFADGSVSGWDSVQGYCTHNFKARSAAPISVLAFHPDPEQLELFVAAEDGSIVAWDLRESRPRCVYSGHVSAVTGLQFDIPRGHLISAGRDKVIRVFSLNDGKSIRTLPVYESVEGLLALGDDAVAVIGDQGHVSSWDLVQGRAVATSPPLASTGHTLKHIVSCRDAFCLVVTSELQLVYLDRALSVVSRMIGHFGEVTNFALVGREQTSLAVSTNGPEICVLPDPESMACVLLPGHTEAVLDLSYCVAGDFLVSASRDSTMRIWPAPLAQDRNPTPATVRSTLCEGHTDAVSAVASSNAPVFPDGAYAVASASSDLTVKMWAVAPTSGAARSLWTAKAHDKEINAVAFSSDNRLLVTAGQDKLIKIWSVASGELLHTLTGHKRGVWSVACTFAQEMLLVSGSADRTVKIWRMTDDFACIKTLEGHANSVLRVAFVNHGLQVVSAGSDGLLKAWDLKRNECLATFDEHTDRIWALAVCDDGDALITGDASATIKVWRDVTQTEIEEDMRRQDELLVKEQQLQVLLLRKDLKNAVILAMSLEQPFRLFKLFDDLLREKSVSEGLALVTEVIGQFTAEQHIKLLEYIREWNLSYKRSFPSQIVLGALLRATDDASLSVLVKEKPAVRDLLKAILPYTEKHFSRTDDLLISSHLVDFALLNMQ